MKILISNDDGYQAPGIVAARSIDLAPMGGSEALLVALIDDDSAIHAADGDGIDAGALALTRGASADDVTIELEELLAAYPNGIEGVRAAAPVMALARRCGVDMPICAEMDAVVNHGRSPAEAYRGLLRRSPQAALRSR